jgi:uncharacterized protein
MSTSQGPRQILAELHKRSVQDVSSTLDLYAEDAVHEQPFGPAGAPKRLEGRESIRRMLDAQSGDDPPVVYTAFENVVVWETSDPEVIIAESDVVGKVAATGASARVSNVLVLRVRNGLIQSTRSYFDSGQLAELFTGD